MKAFGKGCPMRPEGPKMEAKGRECSGVLQRGQQPPPARDLAVM